MANHTADVDVTYEANNNSGLRTDPTDWLYTECHTGGWGLCESLAFHFTIPSTVAAGNITGGQLLISRQNFGTAGFDPIDNSTSETVWGTIVEHQSPAAAYVSGNASTTNSVSKRARDAVQTDGATFTAADGNLVYPNMAHSTRYGTTLNASDLNTAISNNPSHSSTGTVVGIILFSGRIGGGTPVTSGPSPFGYTRINVLTSSASLRPQVSIDYIEGAQTRWLDSTASGSSATSGFPIPPTETIVRFDGTGTAINTDFTGSQGFGSGLVTSGSLAAANGQFGRIVRWVDSSPQYNEPDRQLYCNQTGIIAGYNYAEIDLSGIPANKFARGISLHFWMSYDTVGTGNGDSFQLLNASGDLLVWLYNYQSETTARAIVNNGAAGTGLTNALNRWEITTTGTTSTDTIRLRGFAGNSTTATYDSGALAWGTVANGVVPDRIRIGNISNAIQPNRYFQDLYATTNGVLGEIGNYTPESFVTGTAAGSSAATGAPQSIRYITPSTAHGAARAGGVVTKPGEVLIPTEGATIAAGDSVTSGTFTISHNMGDGQGVASGKAVAQGSVFAGVVYTDISYDYGPQGSVRKDTDAGDANRHPDRRLLDIWLPSEQTHGPGPYPVFFWVHGGSFERGDKSDVWTPGGVQGQPYAMYQALLDDGWAVVSPNYRFKDTFGPNATYIQHPDPVDDIKLALSFLVNNADTYNLDMAKWFMGGHSAGGFLALWAGLTNSMADQSAVPYYLQGTGNTTLDYDVGARYTGDYATHSPKPLGIAVWEAPVALRWSSGEEPNILGQDAYSLDNEIREYLAAPAHTPGSFADLPVDMDDRSSVANANGSNIVTADAPRLFYVYCQTTTNDLDWASITFLPTYGSPSTDGNGYYLKQAASAANVPFVEHRASGADHQTINGFKSAELIAWMNATVEESLFSTASGSSVASGDLTISKNLSGTAAGSSVADGTPLLTKFADSTAAGSSVASGDLLITKNLTGSAAGASRAVGAPFSQATTKYIGAYGVPYGTGYSASPTRGSSAASGAPETVRFLTGSAAGSSVASGAPTITTYLTGTAAGSSVTSGEPFITTYVDGTAAGSSVASGEPEPITTQYVTGSAAGSSVASGSLVITKYVDGAAAGASVASGDLLITKQLGSTAAGSSVATGSLTLTKWLDSAAAGASRVVGIVSNSNVKLIPPADATVAAGSSVATGDPFLVKAISGTATGSAFVSGEPTNSNVKWLDSSSSGNSQATGTVTPTVWITPSSAAGAAAASGEPETVTTQNVTGTAAGASKATGVPSAQATGTDKTISGIAAGASTASGDLTITKFLTGTAAGSSATSGAPSSVTTTFVSGSALGSSVASGDLTVIKLLSAPIQGVSRALGEPTVTGFLPLSTASGTSAASGLLNVGHDLASIAAGSSATSGTPSTVTMAFWAVKNGQVYPAKISAWIDSTGTLHVGTEGLRYLGVVGTDL